MDKWSYLYEYLVTLNNKRVLLLQTNMVTFITEGITNQFTLMNE